MNTTKNMILNKIDEMKDVDYYAEMNVLNAMVDTYCKAAMILENCDESTDVSSFRLFQEGYYMEDGEEGDTITKTDDGGYKINNSDQTYYTDKGFRRMKEDGSGLESIVWSIIAAIPRMIIAAIQSMFGNKKSPEKVKEEINETKKTAAAVQQSPNNGGFGEAVSTLTNICKNHTTELAIAGGIAGGGLLAGTIAVINKFKNKANNELDAANVFKKLQSSISADPAMKEFIKIDEFNAGRDLNFTFDAQKGEIITEVNLPAIIVYYAKLGEVFNNIAEYLSNRSFINKDSQNQKEFNKNDNSANIISKFYNDAGIQPFELFSSSELFHFPLDDALSQFYDTFAEGKKLEESMKKVGSQMEELKELAKNKKTSTDIGDTKKLKNANAARINNLDKDYVKTIQTHVSVVHELNIGIQKMYNAINLIFHNDTLYQIDEKLKQNMTRLDQILDEAETAKLRQTLTDDGWTEDEIEKVQEKIPEYLKAFNIGSNRQQYFNDKNAQAQAQTSLNTASYNGNQYEDESPIKNDNLTGTDYSGNTSEISGDGANTEQVEESAKINTKWSFTFNG